MVFLLLSVQETKLLFPANNSVSQFSTQVTLVTLFVSVPYYNNDDIIANI